MKIWNFISGWHSRSALARCGLLGMMILTSIGTTLARQEDMPEVVDMSFIEFLGEGIEVDQDFIDPLQLREYEDMLDAAQQEEKQQND